MVQVALMDAGPVTSTLFGQVTVRPVLGEVELVRLTFPMNPNFGTIMMVDVPWAPELKSVEEETGKMSNSGVGVRFTKMYVLRDNLPLVPAI